ncbi:POA1 [Candida theae]|uniref:ADP-ribose 1''-phosphate phosphatase n=1 Tax=Candida theae TaxID=1198502 RepID=A0AAD5BE12_9ASCO|nr:POA1 [Candida theae]KAI5957825.1 POA1 [Candida theae]
MTIKYITGDLFRHTAQAGKSVVLAHACNTGGSWGGGIAAVFRNKFPIANSEYTNYCLNNTNLLGTSLLLEADDFEQSRVYIACLFTSDFSQSPEQIASHTYRSLKHLAKQLESIDGVEAQDGKKVVNMPKINAGIFGVPWELTEGELKKVTNLEFNVYVL